MFSFRGSFFSGRVLNCNDQNLLRVRAGTVAFRGTEPLYPENLLSGSDQRDRVAVFRGNVMLLKQGF